MQRGEREKGESWRESRERSHEESVERAGTLLPGGKDFAIGEKLISVLIK